MYGTSALLKTGMTFDVNNPQMFVGTIYCESDDDADQFSPADKYYNDDPPLEVCG